MKNLIILFLAIAVISCKKEVRQQTVEMPAASKGSSYAYYFGRVHVNDTAQGFRSTFSVVNLSGGNQKSVWNSAFFLLADGRIGWIQAGYVANQGTFVMTPDGFPETGSQISGVSVGSYPKLSTTMTVTYYVKDGNAIVNINGKDICYYPCGAVAVYDGDIAIESAPTYSGNFPSVDFYPAFEFLKNGVWGSASHAYQRNSIAYGAIGVNQNGALKFNEVIFNGKNKNLTENLQVF